MKKIFIAVVPFVLLLLSCKEESAVQSDSTVTTYALRSADGHSLPSFKYFLDLPDIDTGYVAVANEGSITVTRYASHPADDFFKIRFVYGYGLKYGSVMEATFKTYEKQLSYAAFTDTLYTGYFPLIKSGDSLVVNYPLKHDDRPDLNMQHTFRLVFR